MRAARPEGAVHAPNIAPVAVVLDQAVRHHDMGINDILVEERSGFDPGPKE